MAISYNSLGPSAMTPNKEKVFEKGKAAKAGMDGVEWRKYKIYLIIQSAKLQNGEKKILQLESGVARSCLNN